jgi:hypothetical protein
MKEEYERNRFSGIVVSDVSDDIGDGDGIPVASPRTATVVLAAVNVAE